MRVKTLRTQKKDEFDLQVNNFLKLVIEQGYEVGYIQITHLQEEYIASIIYTQSQVLVSQERGPEFLEVGEDKVPVQSSYTDIDKYEKY